MSSYIRAAASDDSEHGGISSSHPLSSGYSGGSTEERDKVEEVSFSPVFADVVVNPIATVNGDSADL